MTPDQWERLKVLFHGALAQRVDRQHWLSVHAAGDEMLEREAAALIQAHETADDFLETPVAVDDDDLAEALHREKHTPNALETLEREIETSVRAHDAAARELTDARRPFDQLMVAIVRRVRRLLD